MKLLTEFLLGVAVATAVSASTNAQSPLPSWNDGATKQAILEFVANATDEGSADFVPARGRIATFDNDGTLWCEQPIYVQFAFAIDRVQAVAPDHPEWKDQEPFKFVLTRDMKGLLAGGEKAVMELVAATHAGMTVDQFDRTVHEWIISAKHPKTGKLYVQMVYQPMLELLAYLRANGFKTYIVSGGGVEFMRPWTERVYGIPPEQVIGSRGKYKYELRDGRPALLKLPEIDLVDDKSGKPVGIQQVIGRRPVMAFGNSDGDYQMLEWTTAKKPDRKQPGFGLIVHHTDSEREYAYDRDSAIGRLDKALDNAPAKGWIVVDMKSDWNKIWPSP